MFVQKIMEQYKEFIKSNLAIFSLAGYGLGLLYMSIYYFFFNVPIIYYLTLNDMLFFSFTLILPVVFIVPLLEYLVFSQAKALIYKNELNAKQEVIFAFWSIIAITVLMIIFMNIRLVQINPNLIFYVMFISFSLIAKLVYNVKDSDRPMIVILAVFGLLGSLVFLIDYSKKGLANKDVQFKYKNELIKTSFNHDLNYIGETSNTLFLYNFRKKISYVYEKENLSNLTYIDKVEREYSPKKDIQLYAIKIAKRKINTDTIYKPYEWATHDNKTFFWTAEKNAVGLSRVMWEINYILENNGFDYDDPSHGHSSLPVKMDINEDYKATSDFINYGNGEVHKKWENSSGVIDFQLNNKYYLIQVEIKKKRK